jgi:uncharacterized protein (TIGR00255 family)
MIHSMTGFGRATASHDVWELQVELSSLNNRYLEVGLKLPRQLMAFQHKLRGLLKKSVSRGKLNLFISLSHTLDPESTLQLDAAAAEAYVKISKKFAADFGIQDTLGTHELLSMDGVLGSTDAKTDETALENLCLSTVQDALEAFLDARLREGKVMHDDLMARLTIIGTVFEEIVKAWEASRPLRRQQLQDKLERLIENSKLKAERFEMEVAILLDKQDISEEITRFRSHVDLFRQTLEGAGPVGSKLNFVLQEMIREANTVSSKSPDTGITHMVVQIKEEVERIREQVQNIE